MHPIAIAMEVYADPEGDFGPGIQVAGARRLGVAAGSKEERRFYRRGGSTLTLIEERRDQLLEAAHKYGDDPSPVTAAAVRVAAIRALRYLEEVPTDFLDVVSRGEVDSAPLLCAALAFTDHDAEAPLASFQAALDFYREQAALYAGQVKRAAYRIRLREQRRAAGGRAAMGRAA